MQQPSEELATQEEPSTGRIEAFMRGHPKVAVVTASVSALEICLSVDRIAKALLPGNEEAINGVAIWAVPALSGIIVAKIAELYMPIRGLEK